MFSIPGAFVALADQFVRAIVSAAEKKTVVFVDSTVEDRESLIAGVDPTTEVFVLDDRTDGIAQITKILTAYKQVAAVHIVSHGSSGCLQLGNGTLDVKNIEEYATDINKWRSFLASDADILIYGCRVAAGEAGTELIEKLHQITGVNIAASATVTGNAAKGGNWNLEVSVGEISAPLAFSREVQTAYAGILASAINVSTTDDLVDGDTSSILALIISPGNDGAISLREAVIAANNTPEDDTIFLTSGEDPFFPGEPLTYFLWEFGPDEDSALTGDLDIQNNGSITIRSTVVGSPVIIGDRFPVLGDRIFDVLPDASLTLADIIVMGGESDVGGGIRVNQSNLELTDSSVSGNEAFIAGGGIYNYQGTVSLANSTISENSASQGAGIFHDGTPGFDPFIYGGTVSLTDSTVSGNQAFGGGGLYIIEATANITNSTIASNTAFGPNSGGVYTRLTTATITNSTITNNHNGGITIADSTATIANSTISDNDGGGIAIVDFSTATIANSTISGNTGFFEGGGVYTRFSTADITNSTISGNEAFEGGGIGNDGGTLSIANSVIESNTAVGRGGGIENTGSITLTDSTVRGNTASEGGGFANNGDVMITSSTINSNTASNNGGGIYNQGPIDIINTTISDNEALVEGGGIYDSGFGLANLDSTTITNNRALNNMFPNNGSGIRSVGGTSVGNSIIAGNLNDEDVDGGFFSNGHNLIGNGGITLDFIDGVNGDQVGTPGSPIDPLLSPLQNNGGPTLTHLPLAGSSAIDNGLTFEFTDQRGVTRPQGFQEDIGAVEVGGGAGNVIVVDIIGDENDGIIGDGNVSLRDAIIHANNNLGDFTILVEAGQTYTLSLGGPGEDDAIVGDLDIQGDGSFPSRTITIQTIGTGEAVIDASGIDRVFDVHFQASLSLNNVKVTGGDAFGPGGGGIFVRNEATLEVTDSTISGNTAQTGGGIYNRDGNVNLTNTTISNNEAFSEGGGIFNEIGFVPFPGYELKVNLTNSTISGNIAQRGGGVYNRQGMVNLTDSNISGNTAFEGGGVFTSYSIGLANSTISGNEAQRGGGVYNQYGEVNLTDSTISGNSALDGGGIFNNIRFGPPPGYELKVHLANSTISGNTADRGGGVYNQAGIIDLTDSTISGNSAFEGGGIFNAFFSTADLTNSIISGNSADWGGGIYNRDGITNIADSIVSGNSANLGGGIVNFFSGTANITNSTVSGNSATNVGGILNENTLTLIDSIVSGNQADFHSGGIDNGGTANITNSTISGNSAQNGGGISNIGTANITNSTIISNSAFEGGGIVNGHFVFSKAIATISDSTISGNTAQRGGGLLNLNQSTVNLTDNTTVSSNAANDGGGIFNDNGTATITNSTISGNSAQTGGGISNTGTADITNSTIIGNSAFEGGGIVNGNFGFGFEAIATISDSTISGNTAQRGGGLLNLIQSTIDLTDNTTVSGNTAGDGAGIFNDNGTATITNSNISTNTASNYGGGIVSGGTTTISNSTINNNTADFGGGGIYNSFGTVSLTDNSNVTGNMAGDGGGIFNSHTTTIANSTISGNDAFRGSGLLNEGSVGILNSTISSNTAQEGSGIYNRGTASIANTTISGNTAFSNGGGLFNSSSGTASLLNSTISGNTAAQEGGGIRNNSGTVSLTNTTVTENSASFNGSGISSQGTTTLANTIAAGNANDSDVNGFFISDGHNLIGNGDNTINFINGVNGDQVGTAASPIDPTLGPLQDNGGPTFTHALLSDSPAINAGNNALLPTDVSDIDNDGNTVETISIDQRGEDRIQGTVVDIGAYESSVVFANFAPVLDTLPFPLLAAINEDEDPIINIGDTVAEIVVDNSISDIDGSPVEAIAVTSVDNTNGTWQYSTDGGSNWDDFSATTGSNVDLSTASRLLDSNNRIRFVPDAEYSGSATFTFRAWDKFAGTVGGTEDTTTNGGSTAFSSAADTAEITIIVVDDAPDVQNAIADVTVDENAPDTIIDLSNVFTDVDNDDAAITKAAIANTNPGLVTANIAGDTLTLDYQLDQFGTADITVEATSNGKTVTDTFTVTVNEDFSINAQSANWEIQDAADFDGDGKADLLWRDPNTGDNQLWLMDGGTVISTNNLNFASTNWDIKGVNDFNGDNKADILLRNSVTGENSMWLYDGATRIESGNINRVVLDWDVADTNDFNGDNKADILLRNSVTGENSMWLYDGRTRIESGNINRATVDWEVADTNDFNGDGNADILLRNSIGQNSLWTMDGRTRIGSGNINGASPEWKVADTNDFNGDNKADILWRNTVTGENTLWMMDDRTRIDTSNIGGAAIRWEVGGTSDFDGDGDTDIFWRDPLTGENALWLMDGVNSPGGILT